MTFSEFATCALAGAKAEMFSSTWFDAFGLDKRTWITEDQLRIPLSPMLVAELKGTWLCYECPVLEILRNRLLTEHISNSVFSPSLEPCTI